MSMPTETLHDPISRQQLEALARMAQQLGLSVDDFLWEAALAFQAQQESASVTALLQQLERSAARTCATIDATNAFVQASNERMAALETALHREP